MIMLSYLSSSTTVHCVLEYKIAIIKTCPGCMAGWRVLLAAALAATACGTPVPQWAIADHDPLGSRTTPIAGIGLPLPPFVDIGPSMLTCPDVITSPPPPPVVDAAGGVWIACSSLSAVRYMNVSTGQVVCSTSPPASVAGNVLKTALLGANLLVLTNTTLFAFAPDC